MLKFSIPCLMTCVATETLGGSNISLTAKVKDLFVYQVCIVGYDIDKLRPDIIVSDCILFIMGSDPGYIGY